MDVDHDRLLSRVDLARILGVSARTVRRMDRDGTGPRAIRPTPRSVRYPAADVAEFLNAAAFNAPAEIRAEHGGSLLSAVA